MREARLDAVEGSRVFQVAKLPGKRHFLITLDAENLIAFSLIGELAILEAADVIALLGGLVYVRLGQLLSVLQDVLHLAHFSLGQQPLEGDVALDSLDDSRGGLDSLSGPARCRNENLSSAGTRRCVADGIARCC